MDLLYRHVRYFPVDDNHRQMRYIAHSDDEPVMNKTVQVAIRFPADVKAWLAAQAEKNGSSQNSEVIRAVRERMERAETATA